MYISIFSSLVINVVELKSAVVENTLLSDENYVHKSFITAFNNISLVDL